MTRQFFATVIDDVKNSIGWYQSFEGNNAPFGSTNSGLRHQATYVDDLGLTLRLAGVLIARPRYCNKLTEHTLEKAGKLALIL